MNYGQKSRRETILRHKPTINHVQNSTLTTDNTGSGPLNAVWAKIIELSMRRCS